MLYEIFDEVMREQEEQGDAYQKALNTLLGFLEKNGFTDAAEHNSSTSKTIVITNAGGRPDRDRLIKKMAKEIPGVTPNNEDKKDTLWFYKGEIDGFKFELRKGASKTTAPTATEFEEFLIAAINPAQEADIRQKYNKYKEEVVDEYIGLARSIIAGLGENTPKGKEVVKTSGKGLGQVSQFYKDHGVISGEPKTDFIAGKDKISVKRKAASQYSSAQSNEFAAMVDYVFAKKGYDKQVREYVINLINKTLTKENNAFYDLRESEGFSSKTDFDKQMTTLLFRVPPKTEQQAKWRNSIQGVLLLESAKISDELLKKYADILGKPDFRTALLHEAMTGTGKFVGGKNSPAVPNYLLEWDMNDPNKSEYAEITDDLVNKKMKFTLLRISDRGDKRGGAFRSDAKDKEVKSYFNEQALAGYEPTEIEPETKPTEIDPETENYINALVASITAGVSEIEKKISDMTATQLLDYFGGIIEYQYTEPKNLIDPEEE